MQQEPIDIRLHTSGVTVIVGDDSFSASSVDELLIRFPKLTERVSPQLLRAYTEAMVETRRADLDATEPSIWCKLGWALIVFSAVPIVAFAVLSLAAGSALLFGTSGWRSIVAGILGLTAILASLAVLGTLTDRFRRSRWKRWHCPECSVAYGPLAAKDATPWSTRGRSGVTLLCRSCGATWEFRHNGASIDPGRKIMVRWTEEGPSPGAPPVAR